MVKFMNIIRYLFVFVLFIVLVNWIMSRFSIVDRFGLIVDTTFGIFTFFIFLINCYACLLMFKEDKYKELANRMTLFTLSIYVFIFFIPSILDILKNLNELQLRVVVHDNCLQGWLEHWSKQEYFHSYENMIEEMGLSKSN